MKVPVQFSHSYSYLDPTLTSTFFYRKPSVYTHLLWGRGARLSFMSTQKCKFNLHYISLRGYTVEQLVEALSNKPEGRGFDSRCCR